MSTKTNSLILAALPVIQACVRKTAVGKSRANREEIAQEVVVQILSGDKLAGHDSGRDFNAFVYAVARNLTIDVLRYGSYRVTKEAVEDASYSDDKTAVQLPASHFPSPEAVAIRRDFAAKLESAIVEEMGADGLADYLAYTSIEYDQDALAAAKGQSLPSFQVARSKFKACVTAIAEAL